jgi:hypothetical protein
MSMYFPLRAVRPAELRDDVHRLETLFRDDRDTVRARIGRHREEMLDHRYLDHELLYAGAPPHPAQDGPRVDVVLGGRPVFHSAQGMPPFLLLTPERVARVAGYLQRANFTALWRQARDDLLPRYGGPAAEPAARGAFARAHRNLTAFYTRTAERGDAVVKWLLF